MCISIYIHILYNIYRQRCIHLFTYLHTHTTHIYIYIYIYIYTHTHTCSQVHTLVSSLGAFDHNYNSCLTPPKPERCIGLLQPAVVDFTADDACSDDIVSPWSPPNLASTAGPSGGRVCCLHTLSEGQSLTYLTVYVASHTHQGQRRGS